MATIYNDEITFLQPVTFAEGVTLAEAPVGGLAMFGPIRVDLKNTATGTTYSFMPLIAGKLEAVAMVLDGAETTVGAAAVTVSITNSEVTLSAALTQPSGTAAGITKTVTIGVGQGIFTATDFITITTASTNTATTFGGITLKYTRA